MTFRVETVILGPDTDQYAGKGQEVMTIQRIADEARAVEALGFDGLTTPEAGHDPYLPLTICAEHTERVTLGTNVAISFPRSPMVTAQIAWDLQQLSGGRFELGLGTQVKGHNERRYAAPWTGPPGPRMRDYVTCLRAMFDAFQKGEKPSFMSKHYQFTLMSPFFNPGPIEHSSIPIHVAAVNTYMARMAGELCDGLRLHPIATFRYTEQVIIPTIASGAKEAGRSPSAVNVIGAPFLAIAPDEDGLAAAKDALRQHIAFYASTRTYHAVLEFHGWTDVGMRLHQLSKEGKWTEMPKLISDEMLDEWAIVGTYDQLVPKLKERCAGVFQTILLDLPSRLKKNPDRVREIVAELRKD